jgi:hypothetical protein
MARLIRTRDEWLPPEAVAKLKYIEKAKTFVSRTLFFKSITELLAYSMSDFEQMMLEAMANQIKMENDAREAGRPAAKVRGPAKYPPPLEAPIHGRKEEGRTAGPGDVDADRDGR